MIWSIFGIVIYVLALRSERVLVDVSPHDLEQLRTDDNRRARFARLLALDIRGSLAAMLLLRLLLKTWIAVFLVLRLAGTPALRTALYNASQHSGLPGWLIWGAALLAPALLLAFAFAGLQKFKWPLRSSERAREVLQRLSPFIYFWKVLFSPLLPKRKQPARSDMSPALPDTQADTPAGLEAAKQRDIELLKSIVKFSDVTVKQVMQPRSKVVAVDFRTRFDELLRTVQEAGFSRMPVYDEDLDNITGILYVKDLVPHLDKPDTFEWQSLIRTTVPLVPEAKRVSELLQEFKRNKRHMAIVVDEYGGSSGIVTMEDILEEVTGEIRDEFDEESEIRYRKLDENNYLFEGQTLLNDVCRIAGLHPEAFDDIRANADTIAGLALEIRGDIPQPGTELRWSNYQLTIVAADERRIGQLKFTILD